MVVSGIEIGRLQQFEIRESPDLIGQAAKKIRIVHRRVGGNDTVEFGNNDETVGRKQGVGECRVGVAYGTDDFAAVVDFHRPPVLPSDSGSMLLCAC